MDRAVTFSGGHVATASPTIVEFCSASPEQQACREDTTASARACRADNSRKNSTQVTRNHSRARRQAREPSLTMDSACFQTQTPPPSRTSATACATDPPSPEARASAAAAACAALPPPATERRQRGCRCQDQSVSTSSLEQAHPATRRPRAASCHHTRPLTCKHLRGGSGSSGCLSSSCLSRCSSRGLSC